jgi:hypothetical protein
MKYKTLQDKKHRETFRRICDLQIASYGAASYLKVDTLKYCLFSSMSPRCPSFKPQLQG